MRKKLFSFLMVLFASVSLYATDLNIYASGLRATQSAGVTTIEYTLNAQATAVNLKLYDGASLEATLPITGASNLTAGSHSVIVDLSDVAVGTYTWKLEASAASNGLAAPALVNDTSKGAFQYYLPQDVVVDNNFESPYFGRIYVSESMAGANDGSTITTKNQTRGIYIYNPDLTFFNGESTALTGYEGGMAGSGRTSCRRLTVDEAGNVYVCSTHANNKGVYRMDPANPSANFTQVLSGKSVNAFEVVGSTLYTLENIDAASRSYNIYDISSLPATSPSTTAIGSSFIYFANEYCTIRDDKNGGFWLAEYRGYASYNFVVHLNASGEQDFVIDGNNQSTYGLNFTYRGTIAVSPDGSMLAIGSNAKVVVYDVAYDGAGAPSLTQKYSISRSGSNTDGIAFDVAGNLYVLTASIERFYIYAFPKAVNSFETPAPTANTITWDGNVTHVTGVSLNQTSASIVKGGTLTLVPTITPNNATNMNVSWSSNHEEFATVSDEGVVTAVAPGVATITVTTDDGSFTATCEVTVTYTAVSGVALNKSETSLYAGYKDTLTATVTPNDATEPELAWESLSPEIATVSNAGVVTALTPGTAQIVVKSVSNEEKTDTCEVTVTAYAMSLNTYYKEKTFAQLTGKTIRRIVPYQRFLYILALDAESEPYVYRINTQTEAVVSIPTDFCSKEDASGLKLSDIAVTSDGVLVGCNKEKCTFTPANSFKVYKWTETDGVFTGSVWFSKAETKTCGNFTTAYTGETMVYVGSSAAGKLVTSAMTTGAETGAIRLYICNISGGAVSTTSYNRTAAPLRKAEMGADFKLNVLADGVTFVMDGSLSKPYQFKLIASESATMPSSLLMPTADVKAISNYLKYDGRQLALTNHFAEANNDGYVVSELINDLDPAVNVSSDALTAKTATFASAVGEVLNGNAYVYVLRDDELSVFTTGAAPAEHLYEYGENQGWNQTQGVEMTKIATNLFKKTISFPANSYMAFSTVVAENQDDGGWTYVNNHRYSSPSENLLVGDGSIKSIIAGGSYNYKIADAGKYNIIVNLDEMTIQAIRVFDNLYMIGSNQGWDPAQGVELKSEVENIFMDTLVLTEDTTWFALTAARGTWDQVNACRFAGANKELLSDGSKMNLTAGGDSYKILPGEYVFTVDMNAKTIQVDQIGGAVQVTDAGYATYYDGTHAYTLPAEMEGYVFSVAGGLVKEYDGSANVAADEALVLKAPAGKYALPFVDSGTAAVGANDLLGTDVKTDLAVADADAADYFYYGLSLNSSNDVNSVGFYWMNATGAAFTNGAHKAYLRVAKGGSGAATRFYLFHGGNDATGVVNVENAEEAVKFFENGQLFIRRNGVVYDAAGRMVRK